MGSVRNQRTKRATPTLFDIDEPAAASSHTIRAGGPPVVYTIGYERRSPDDLLAQLREAGVQVLADIRAKPISRRVEFRAGPLRESCVRAGIIYQPWPELGATEAQRALHDRDVEAFFKQYGEYARAELAPHIRRLAAEVARQSVALLCYERAHEECHRMVVAEIVADITGGGIVAID